MSMNPDNPRQGVLHQRQLHSARQRPQRAPLRGVHRAGHVGRRPLRRLPLVPLQQGPAAQDPQGRLQVRTAKIEYFVNLNIVSEHFTILLENWLCYTKRFVTINV